jgi:hypothetical protein
MLFLCALPGFGKAKDNTVKRVSRGAPFGGPARGEQITEANLPARDATGERSKEL